MYALQRAEQAGIEHCVIAKHDYVTQEEFSNAILQQLQSYQIDNDCTGRISFDFG